MSMNRRDFLQGLGLSLGALALPSQTRRVDPALDELFFECSSTAVPPSPMVKAIGADFEAGRSYQLAIELPERFMVRGIKTWVQPPSALAIADPRDPLHTDHVILEELGRSKELGVPNQIAGPVDLCWFATSELFLPVDLPLVNPMPVRCRALKDSQIAVVLWLDGPVPAWVPNDLANRWSSNPSYMSTLKS